MAEGEVEILEKRIEFRCRLRGFSSLDDRVNSGYWSPEFRFCGRGWILLLYPNGREVEHSEGDVDLCLCVWDSGPPTEVRYSAGIVTAGGGTKACVTATKTFDCRLDAVFIKIIRSSDLLQRRDHLLPGDNLTLTLTLDVVDGSSETVLKDASVQTTVETNVAHESVQASVEACDVEVSVETPAENSARGAGKSEISEKRGPEKIVEDVGKLWPNGDHTDVVLKVRGVEFKAHKTILAARAPVLGAMFQHETKEKTSGEVSIDDCEPEVLKELLYHIYKGAPRELTAQNASALYTVADKYLVSEVKALCVERMRDSLCLDTFCDTLTLSLMHGEDELLKAATEFLSRNMIDVMQTVDWQRFLREHPTWSNEIMIRATQLTAAKYEEEKRSLLDQCAR